MRMAEVSEPALTSDGSAKWPVVALGLVAASWAAFLLTMEYADRLQERWGPAPDVVDALGRDAYVSRHTLPYLTAIVALDGAAALALIARSRRGWPLAIKVLAGVLLVPTAGLHGLAWLIEVMFAG
jgi:hypothetical protein